MRPRNGGFPSCLGEPEPLRICAHDKGGQPECNRRTGWQGSEVRTNSRWTERRLDRRALLRGGLLGGAGLAAAALIGCSGSGEDEGEADTLEELRRRRESGASSGASAGHAAASSTDAHGAAQDEHAAASSADAHGASADEHAAPAGAGHGDAPHWAYAGEGGPDSWGHLDAEFSACSAGRNQSPIDIAATTGVGSGEVAFSYQPSSLTVINNGHTIQANVLPGNAISVDGKAFGLLQFHFHSPSEHTLDGRYFPLEMHLVHRNTEGSLGVVGVFFAEGNASDPLEPVWAVMPHSTEEQGIVEGFDLESLLPSSRQLYRYAGSLTTPPCSEGVRWMVMQTPREVSGAQVQAFASLVGPNNRPLQPVWAREVLEESSRNTLATNR